MTQDVRKGQAPGKLDRDAFHRKFTASFYDPRFDPLREQIAQLEDVAWRNYCDSRKAPITVKAGPGFADPDYDLAVGWKAARDRLLEAERRQKDPATPSRVLLVVGAARNDGTCPGEMSKTFRMVELARTALQTEGIEADVLDLSLLTSTYDHHIHPCKGCVSTAMPLCHWPCSCYPNHSLNQVNDWMNEIYERWVLAHGVLIVAPTYWYQSPSPLKLMIDRLVCADGGNPDPSSTHGKEPEEAKALELQGWDYPQHLAGRAYGVFVHGDVAGTESQRRNLADWLDWMGLIAAGQQAVVERYIGYYESYAESHAALDKDAALQEEVRNAARAVAEAVRELRAGRLSKPDARLRRPRPK
ncbi:NADPH-dependent FMN reductase [Pseudoduganella flava]|uniref:NADPH-dependent FMN reductase n=1 Tax=Pseudoduganella flava TaxID=871742 RepID=A0A562PRK6_9BURK|nr:flavodoxin family protein [Pseudoduganella flava]QGZ37875.1 NADPH-dependent FMN reductase [Pseudoduganella flava]TWI46706.1 NADPH-dependent FMN reductase [Pseudoduganella flava]